jgi:K+-sensing histidine kinase KdpD
MTTRELTHLRAVVAALIPFATFAVEWFLWPLLRPFAWVPFAFAVAISAWMGGVAAGVWATGVSTALVLWAFVPPERSFQISDAHHVVSAAMFALLGLGLSAFQGRLRRAVHEAEGALDAAHKANEKSGGSPRSASSSRRW